MIRATPPNQNTNNRRIPVATKEAQEQLTPAEIFQWVAARVTIPSYPRPSLKRTNIQHVIIYTGHSTNKGIGPYAHSIAKRLAMFSALNECRKKRNLVPWNITSVQGEYLTELLRVQRENSTLLVFPAGESSDFDASFTENEIRAIQIFFSNGGRGYFTCGAAYWVAKKRIWSAPCRARPEGFAPIEKESRIPLFNGVATGPLCPYPGQKYQVGFYSRAITVTNGQKECTVYVGGGGSFILTELQSYLKESIISELNKTSIKWKGSDLSNQPSSTRNSLLKEVTEKRKKKDGVLLRKVTSLPEMSRYLENSQSLSIVTDQFLSQKNRTFSEVIQQVDQAKKNSGQLAEKILQELRKIPDISSKIHSDSEKVNTQKVRILARYKLEELAAIGKKPLEARKLENAAIMVSYGLGGVILAHFHPYYDANEIDPERYKKMFPDSGTDWKDMAKRLSSLEERIDFLFTMFEALEKLEFEKPKNSQNFH